MTQSCCYFCHSSNSFNPYFSPYSFSFKKILAMGQITSFKIVSLGALIVFGNLRKISVAPTDLTDKYAQESRTLFSSHPSLRILSVFGFWCITLNNNFQLNLFGSLCTKWHLNSPGALLSLVNLSVRTRFRGYSFLE